MKNINRILSKKFGEYSMFTTRNPECYLYIKKWKKQLGAKVSIAIKEGDTKKVIELMRTAASYNSMLRYFLNCNDWNLRDQKGNLYNLYLQPVWKCYEVEEE